MKSISYDLAIKVRDLRGNRFFEYVGADFRFTHFLGYMNLPYWVTQL